ncbi:MAG: response regulator [Elusimicrobiota bacterium]
MNDNKKKVLVVDDDIQAVEMLSVILEDKGFEVIPAYVGEIGLKKAKTHLPDIIILDITMPGMDGFKVCEEIKRNPSTSHIPIIMLTGKDMGKDFDKAMEKKADWYVVKPYNIEHLLKVFDRLIK